MNRQKRNLKKIIQQIQVGISLLLVCCSTFIHDDLIAQAAFPGAKGFGSDTPGGRGGQIIEVTNLNAKGKGSLEAACQTKGKRIIVFRVGGIIELTENIEIVEPFVTIGGQTAPGDGICIKGAGLHISTHDVIIRGLRVRVGDDPNGPDPENRDGIDINNHLTPTYNIIIDHCSVSWAIDGNLDLWYPCHDITIQYCILSEALHKSLHPKGAHSTGLLVGDHAKRISVHHNLFAHNNGRNPLMKFDTETEVINNVVFDWGTWGGTDFSNYEDQDYTVSANIIGNVFIPLTLSESPISIDRKIRPGSKVFVKGNIGPGRSSDNGDDWLLVNGDKTHRVNSFAFPPSDVTDLPASQVIEHVLQSAGATIPHRDPVDMRALQTTRDVSGRIIDSQSEVGGWPIYSAGEAPSDRDHDGMPDDWEAAQGLNPDNYADANGMDLSPEGYTNIEVYINELFD